MEATARWRGQKSWWSNKRRRMGKIFVLLRLSVCLYHAGYFAAIYLEPQTCPHDTLSFNSKSISICIILIVVKDSLHLGITFVAAKYVAEVPQRKPGWAKEQSGHREQDTGLAAAIRRIQVQPLRQNGWDRIVVFFKQIMIFEHMVGHLCLSSFSRTCDAWCVQATASSTRRSSNMCCPTSVCPPRMPGPATCCFQMWVATHCSIILTANDHHQLEIR